MLSASLLREWELCLIGALTGMEMMAAYDLVRVCRNLRLPGRLRVNVEDVLFWVCCGFLTFFMILRTNDGNIRWYVLVSQMLGMILWRHSLSPLLVGGLTAVLRFLGRILSQLWRMTVKFGMFCGKPLKYCRRWFTIKIAAVVKGWRSREETVSERQDGRNRGDEEVWKT